MDIFTIFFNFIYFDGEVGSSRGEDEVVEVETRWWPSQGLGYYEHCHVRPLLLRY